MFKNQSGGVTFSFRCVLWFVWPLSSFFQITEDDGFPQNICENCANQLEIAYQFRILSEVSELKLKSKVTIIDEQNIVEVDSIEECDDGITIGGNASPVFDQMEASEGFEMCVNEGFIKFCESKI